MASTAAVDEPSGPVRVRFAPSPTGMLHLGGLRTALFNYLLARRHGGAFILRIEDTDQKRLVPGAAESIVRTLEWAGLPFDEGPGKGGPAGIYHQSQRGDIYRRHAQILLDSGAAYRCFCTAERLEALRADTAARGKTPAYDRRCLHLSQRQIDEKLRAGEPYTVRLLAPNSADPAAADVARFTDAVHGHMHFSGPAGFDDAVLLKSDGLPTYHLANVVDDHAMEITHVLRGEEWLMSTPKHRALFKAFGWPIPQYAHLPLLMNPDGTKLSKRNRDGPIQTYIDDGYLPAALVNYAALLGWNPGGAQEVFSLAELEQAFSLAGLGRSKSVVSRARLDWLNRQHLHRDISDPARCSVLAQQANDELAPVEGGVESVRQALQLSAGRLTFLRDLREEVPFLFGDPDLGAPATVQLQSKIPAADHAAILRAALDLVDARADAAQAWTGFAADAARAAQAPPKLAMMALRHALTGQPRGPPIPDILAALTLAAIRRR
ncbi:Glutamate--tRNA ligase mitochondrial, partial [Coemansia helicoidea]